MLILLLFLLLVGCHACRYISMRGEKMGANNLEFELLSHTERQGMHSHRPVYASKDISSLHETFYLYHITANSAVPGRGRWVLNDVLGDKDNAIAYVDSWAVAPHLVQAVNDVDKVSWVVSVEGGGWDIDETLTVYCSDEIDRTLFFDSPVTHKYSSGFFTQVYHPYDSTYNGPLYQRVQEFEDMDPIYLFRFEDRWLIGNDYTKDSCFAFFISESEFIEDLDVAEWNFVVENDPSAGFVKNYARFIHARTIADDHDNVYEALRRARSIPSIPQGQTYADMRNNVPLPRMGLGTGGLIPGQEMHETMATALKLGYRMFDLAREYGNERTMGEVIEQAVDENDDRYAARGDVFVISKVWPTDLGFIPTTDALYMSLQDLGSTYIDMYLLHWPKCEPSVTWMHCETTVDPSGTWQESWHALEKAYAEGRLNSIGVSNFDTALLEELGEMSTVRPHLVQNHAAPGNVDREVRRWCEENFVMYQPYASLRNMASTAAPVKSSLRKIASEKGVSEHAIALKFFIQTEAIVIPRSKNTVNLKNNLDVMSLNFDLTLGELSSLGWSA